MRLINRTFAVLKELSSESTGLTLQELSQRTEIPVGSVHRLLGVLSTEELVVRCLSTRRYFVGPAVAGIGAASVKGRRLQREAPRAILDAAGSCEETFHLTELVDANHAVCVAVAYGRRLARPPALLGREFPLGIAPATRVLLSNMHEDFVTSAVRRNVPARDVDDTLSRVRNVRRSGFDAAPGDPEEGLWTLSVPLQPRPGRAPQSLSIVTSARRARRPSTRLALYHSVTGVARSLGSATTPADGHRDADTVMHPTGSRPQESVRIAGAV